MRRFTIFPVLLFVAVSLHAQAPHWSTEGCNGDEGNAHNNSWGFFHQERICEVRRTELPLIGSQLNVEGTDGGVEVIGEDRDNISLEARITAYASSKDEAQKIEREVKIVTNGTIHDEGPRFSGWFSRSGYSVNYRLHVPHQLSAELTTVNGGVDIKNLEGVLHAKTTNGGLSLDNLAGDVHARTVNGGVEVKLTGDSWRGAGLSVNSVNGGITVTAPDHYSAHLVAQTVNGGISVDFPVTVQGTIKNSLDTNLGQGGPIIHLQTVNGGVSISR